MNTPADPGESLGKVIGAWVAGAVIAVAVVGGSVDGLLAAAASGKLEASAADYMTFGQLYLATLLLSATLTLAISVYAVPALDGTRVHWALPLGIVVAGALMTGLPVQSTGSNGPVGILEGAVGDVRQVLRRGVRRWCDRGARRRGNRVRGCQAIESARRDQHLIHPHPRDCRLTRRNRRRAREAPAVRWVRR